MYALRPGSECARGGRGWRSGAGEPSGAGYGDCTATPVSERLRKRADAQPSRSRAARFNGAARDRGGADLVPLELRGQPSARGLGVRKLCSRRKGSWHLARR